ncbi:MAG: hypothetical protein ACXWLK_06525 [Rhizomicrobium sp.]
MRKALLCLAVTLPAAMSCASAATIDLNEIETKDLLMLYFDPTETYLTPYIGRNFENSLAFQKRTFDWKPWEPTTLLLKDFSDYGNAAARSVPNGAVLIDIAPLPLTFETFSPGERFYTIMNHEMVHVATMDVWNSSDAFWRHVFHGKPEAIQAHPESILYNYLAAPRATVPRWYLEGSAVFMETWMGGGLGRAQGAYDEMVFRAMVRDNAHFYSPLGLEAEGTQVDFQVGVNDYLYGTRFFSYLALTYSPAKVVEWLKRDEDSAAYYSSQFERVFGKPLDAAWNDWISYEHEFQNANLASVHQYPNTDARRLTNRTLGSISRAFLDPATKSLVGGFRYPGVISHIGELSLADGALKHLVDLKGPMLYKVTSLAFDPEKRLVFYTDDNYAYRDVMQLNLATGKTKLLLRDARIGDLVFNPADSSLWGLRHLNGYATLVRIPAPYEGWNQIHTFPFGEVPFDLDISPDGKFMSASVGEVNGDQKVRVFKIDDLIAGTVAPVSEFNFGQSVPEGFVFSPDGKFLYGSDYYTGVSNIFRYEIATGKTEAVSNAVTGYFRPIPQADGSLIVFEFTGQGFTPVVIDPRPLDNLGTIKFLGTEVINKHPELKTYAVGSPADIPLESMITKQGKYVPFDHIRLDANYPVIMGYKGHAAFGWHAIFEDPLAFEQILATVAYSPAGDLPTSEQFHVNLEYKTPEWHFRYWHNDANFYDLFGPVDRSLKGDAIMAGYKHPLIYDLPRELDVTADMAYYTSLDQLPGFQNVSTTLDRNILSADAGLKYVNTAKSLGAVDHEEGWGWNLDLSEDYAAHEVFPKIRAGLDFGYALPWNHSSLWLYSAAGIAGGSRLNPLTFYYFGSFRNNFVDNGEVKRYREYDSFPGFDIDELSARNFVKSVLEWNLPPIRFSDVGTPSLFLSSARPALFGGVLVADPGTFTSQTYETLGAQVDWNFTVALRLPMTFSIGYAEGFVGGTPHRGQILASLKIL